MKSLCPFLLLLLALLAPRPAAAQGEPLGDLRAVRLFGKEDFPTPPLGYAARVFSWDWRDPLAIAEIQRGMQLSTELPRKWTMLEGFEAADEILIQLDEPAEQPGGLWDLAMGYVPAPDPDGAPVEQRELAAQRAKLLEVPCVTVGPTAPWLIAGRLGGEGSPSLPLLDPQRETIGTRWLRPAARLDRLPELKFELRALLSWTDPARGVTRFALVETAGSQYGYFSELHDWLRAMSAPGEWFAVHSIGPHALTSTNADWLADAVDPRTTPRAGVVLRLRPAREGDLVDWARLQGARVKASSYEVGYEPQRIVSNLLWPLRMQPALWISRAHVPGKKSEAPWLELELARPLPIQRVTLVWPTVAGWSPQLLPQQATLTLTSDESGRKTVTHNLKPGDGPTTQIDLPDAGSFGGSDLKRVRLEFNEAGEIDVNQRGRLVGIQLWAPWDGKVLAQPISKP